MLAHLHDYAYLQTHPLARLLVQPWRPAAAAALRQLLLEAIQQLRPPAEMPHQEAAWRCYRLLHLRYVEARSQDEILAELGISERQARRDHREALDAVASILWAAYSSRLPTPAASAERLDQPPPCANDDGMALELEVSRMAAAPAERLVGIRDVVASALRIVGNLARSRRVRLAVSVPPDLRPVAINRSVLHQALVNLFSYAIDLKGEGIVEVSAQQLWRSTRLSVMVREPLVSVTSPLDEPTSTSKEDTRLTASRGLLAMQGGAVEIEQAEGGAVAIAVCLPVAGPATVLVVDDNQDFVRLFRRYLEGSPYQVVHANTGDEAIRLAREIRPEVITLDVMMPSNDGWETLRKLKATRATRGIPVAVCSVLHEPALALSLGASVFLAKPVTQRALLGALDHCCGRPDSRARPDRP